MMGYSMVKEVGRYVVAPHTLIAVVLLTAFCLFHVVAVRAVPGVNAWDAIFPAMTDPLTISMVVLGWSGVSVLREASSVSRETVLIRYGSRARAVRAGLARLTAGLLVLGGLAVTLCAVVGFSLGFNSGWSEHAIAPDAGANSVYDASAYASMFSSPIVAAACSAVFTGTTLLALAALILALAAQGRGKLAAAIFVGVWVWSMLCSFATFKVPVFLDVAVSLSLGWATHTPGGIVVFVADLLVMISVTLALCTRTAVAHRLLAPFTHQATIHCSALMLLAIAWLYARKGGHSSLDQIFAGAHGDIFAYVLIAAVPLILASAAVGRLASAEGGRICYEAIRYGSFRSWQRAKLRVEVGRVLAFYASFLILLCLLLWSNIDAWALLVAMWGMFALTLLYIGVAFAMMWRGVNQSVGWIIVAGVALVGGYWFPFPAVNMLAPYSLAGIPGSIGASVAACIATSVAAVVLTIFVDLSASARRADYMNS